MGVNKVIYGGNTLIDVSETTVTPKTMLKGVTAVDAAGDLITGTLDVNIVEVPESVDFYDYDGTLLYSYTLEEMQALTELPAGATHDGLVFQGWNWSLEDIKAHNRSLVVGALYTTDDGTTRIHIKLTSGRTSPKLGIGVNGSVTINWGDGKTSTVTGTSLDTVQWASHAYSYTGDFTITLTVTGQIKFLGVTGGGSYLLRHTSDEDNRNEVYRNAVKKVEIGNNVAIGDYAFCFCSSLATISMPEYISHIGTGAFQMCNSLRSITLPPALGTLTSTFVSCRSLTTVAVPASLTTLSNGEFNNCYSLKAIALPDGLQRIGNGTFFGCSKIMSLHIPNVTVLGENAFSGCDSLLAVAIPNTVTKIEKHTFDSCGALKSVVLPDNATEIGDYAFYGCKSLDAVKIPDTVVYIGASAFYNCTSLTEVTIPNGVTSIQSNTFQSCNALMSIEIPDSVTSIATNAFNSCESLTTITIPDSVTTIGSGTFQKCNSLSAVTIPDKVTSIEASLFRECISLTSVVIPESVTTIGGYAFYNCHALESIAFPNNITSIGAYAFYNCSSLETVNIPRRLTNIANYTFSRCESLSSIVIPEWENKNLLPFPTSITKGGITFTCDDEGYMTGNSTTDIRGWNTGNSQYSVYLQAGTYVLSFDSKALCTDEHGYVWAMDADNTRLAFVALANKSSGSAEFTLDSDQTVYVMSKMFDGVVAVMIRNASNGDNTYEPYKATGGVKTISPQAFQECCALTEIKFPSSVTSIGNQAFNNCYGMRYYRFPNNLTVPTLGTNVFVGIAEDCEIEVPYEQYDTWKSAANWSTYADYIIKGEPV